MKQIGVNDMICEAPTREALRQAYPTIWGLDPVQVHDRFWAARGVQVVRQGERSQIVRHAELFLLTDPRSLVIFQLGALVDRISWLEPEVLAIRLRSLRDGGYREEAVIGPGGRFVRFQRSYDLSDARMARVALTPSRHVAEMWQNAESPRDAWRLLRRKIPRTLRASTFHPIEGHIFDRSDPRELMQLVREMIRTWKSPDATIHHIRLLSGDVWAHRQTSVAAQPRLVGPAWVGAGRSIPQDASIVGPVVLWDAPAMRPAMDDIEWLEIEPSQPFDRPVRQADLSSFTRFTKRSFDIVFSLAVLAVTLPFYPLIMLAIWIEDGRPFFFVHRRETFGGREFPCIKFRSMRNDADQLKHQLIARNRADGPQFFIDPDDDPRLTRVGKLLRKLNIDEMPQFLNVLAGHMAVVGPRPSPRSENQCCPPWREARLSVRPGITGLWQVMRTRQAGCDFQEWVKYDIRYVERQSWKLDMYIIWRTVLILLKLNR